MRNKAGKSDGYLNERVSALFKIKGRCGKRPPLKGFKFILHKLPENMFIEFRLISYYWGPRAAKGSTQFLDALSQVVVKTRNLEWGQK